MAKLMIDAGAKINLQDKSGNTALHFAHSSGEMVVNYLVKAGGDPNIQNNYGSVPGK